MLFTFWGTDAKNLIGPSPNASFTLFGNLEGGWILVFIQLAFDHLWFLFSFTHWLLVAGRYSFNIALAVLRLHVFTTSTNSALVAPFDWDYSRIEAIHTANR